MADLLSFIWTAASDDSDPPIGSPPDQLKKYADGPWFETQLVLSLIVGLSSFIAFCILRTRWRVLYAPRTLLKGFSPHEVHVNPSFFGWILPTLRTSEYAVLQLVGLDAVVLLFFFKLCFQFFAICAVLGCVILMPINWRENGTIDGVPPADIPTTKDFLDSDDDNVNNNSNLFLTSHLIFTYAFSLIALYMLQRAYSNFVNSKQLFSLDHAHSIPARTVLITRVPPHLRAERQLAEYFENMGEQTRVDSVNVVRETAVLADLLALRTEALRRLESAWTAYIGNPAPPMTEYDRDAEMEKILQPTAAEETGPVANGRPFSIAKLIDLEEGQQEGIESRQDDMERNQASIMQRNQFQLPNKPRPTFKPGVFPFKFFRKSQDLLDHLAGEFRDADQAVLLRRKGRMRPTEVAFVTFETIAGAQIASQVVHYPQPSAMLTTPAPEPRDVHWSNLGLSSPAVAFRQVIVLLALLFLLAFWGTPVWFLARLLSYDSIKGFSPKLAKIINKFPQIRALVQNSLPSLALIAFNALLPYLLEGLCVFQGLRAKSWVEYSLMKKYWFFLLITVFFVFVSVSTITLAKDLAGQPMKFIERLATSLPAAKNFYVSYVMLQGIGLMPVQLVQLAVIIPNAFYRLFLTRTPREYAELNAPPVLNLGYVYPQALLLFLICLTYSIITPLILVFGAIYFGMAYLVYKYKLLNVYYRPFESRGQAWPIAFSRMAFGIVVFQLFMIGLFLVRTAFQLAALGVPLLLGTVYACYRMNRTFSRLARHVNLSQASEVTQQGSAPVVQSLKRANPVTASQTNLNRSRYKHKDDNAYVVAKDAKTDYSQPPLSDVFYGVLNTGRRRYGHPALSGTLPLPWLPSTRDPLEGKTPLISKSEGLVLNLRRRWSIIKRGTPSASMATISGQNQYTRVDQEGDRAPSKQPSLDDATRAWRDDNVEQQDSGMSENVSANSSPRWEDIQTENADDASDTEENDSGVKYKTYYVRRESKRRHEMPDSFLRRADDDEEGANDERAEFGDRT